MDTIPENGQTGMLSNPIRTLLLPVLKSGDFGYAAAGVTGQLLVLVNGDDSHNRKAAALHNDVGLVFVDALGDLPHFLLKGRGGDGNNWLGVHI